MPGTNLGICVICLYMAESSGNAIFRKPFSYTHSSGPFNKITGEAILFNATTYNYHCNNNLVEKCSLPLPITSCMHSCSDAPLHPDFWQLTGDCILSFLFRFQTLTIGGADISIYWKCRSALQEEGLKRWEIGEVASRIGQVAASLGSAC